jgi:hypothetical protein
MLPGHIKDLPANQTKQVFNPVETRAAYVGYDIRNSIKKAEITAKAFLLASQSHG